MKFRTRILDRDVPNGRLAYAAVGTAEIVLIHDPTDPVEGEFPFTVTVCGAPVEHYRHYNAAVIGFIEVVGSLMEEL